MTLPRALAGVRVLDFTWVRAGPWATRWLGAFGADIVKIEWPEHLDILRSNRTTIPPGMEPSPNAPGQFADTNVNKLGLTINVRMPRGLELIKRLIAISDVVIENFSSRVMRNWGIGYDVMQQLKPDIIYVSMAGFGHTGRHHHYTTMGPSAQALSGQTFLSGLPGKPPAGWGWSYLDDTGGMYGAMCVLTALHHRNATGQGQHVDLSQMTAGITLTGPAFLDRTVNGRAARREGYPPGNRTAWPGEPRSITTAARQWRRITPIAPKVVGITTGASSPASPIRNGRRWSISWAVLVGRRMPSSGICRDACSIRRSWTRASNTGHRCWRSMS